jgi:hypothetical protein
MNDTANAAHAHRTTVPEIIRIYQDAHDRHDITTALSAFAADATVADEGHEHHGTSEIRGWLTKTTTEYRYTRTLLGAEAMNNDTWLIRNRLEGNFPGNVVDLRYRFELAGDLITALVIAP